MKNYKKTFLGSIIAFFISSSCCWLSSLAIWIGGAAFIGTIANLIENVQVLFIALGIILLIVTLFSYFKRRNER